MHLTDAVAQITTHIGIPGNVTNAPVTGIIITTNVTDAPWANIGGIVDVTDAPLANIGITTNDVSNALLVLGGIMT